MNASLHWDELELVLALSRSASLAHAAAHLGVHHSTAFRRLERAEERAGVALFHRHQGQYLPTEIGRTVAEHAGRVEDELLGVERALADRDALPRGELRLTTVPSLVAIIMPALARLAEQCPELHIALDATPDALVLERGDADLALRPTAAPPPELLGTKLAALGWATYTRKRGRCEARRIHYAGSLARQNTEPRPLLPRASISVKSVPSMAECIVAGLGEGRLPCYVGDRLPALERVGAVEASDVSLWLLSPVALRKSPRVQATRARLIECLEPELPLFVGG